MAAPLLAGLARVGAGLGRAAATAARGAARSGAKKLVKTKIKSKAKERISSKNNQNKKLSKKSALISSKGDRLEEKLLRSKISEEETTPTLTGTPKKLTIKSAPKSESQIEQLKINVTNIHKFLVKSNRDYARVESKNKRLSKRAQSKIKLGREERQLEKERSPFGKSLKNVKDSVASGAGSMFEKVLEFGALLLAGIIVNALPAIIEKVQEIIDNIVNFLTPIQSGFNLIKGFFTGEIDDSKYDADKKRFSDGMDNINEQIDKISEKMGPFEGLIKMFKPVVDLLSTGSGGKKIVLAKQDGKEGVLNKETGEFTERQFTSAERKQYESQGKKPTSSPDNKPVGSDVSTPVGPITPGGSLDFVGSGDGVSGTLILKDQKGKKLGSWQAISGVFRTADSSQEDRKNVSGVLNPLPDGTYPLMGFGKHGYIGGVGTWSTYINNMTGSIGRRSQILVHNDIGSNGTAGCVGVELGGRSGTDAENKFLKLYEAAKPTSIRVAIGKGANKSTAPPRSTDNTPVTTARINSVDKKSQQMDSINQKDPRKNRRGRTIAVQQVNTIQTAYVPMPIPMKSKSFSSSSSPQLSSIWA